MLKTGAGYLEGLRDDIALSRSIYFDTPAHTLSNHQVGIRYLSKMKLLIGLARRITQSMGIDRVPAVADDLATWPPCTARCAGCSRARSRTR